tara:strand:+ start:1283 stop:1549 length:267 start_codon:yes stop_codon:yes gene_type:complete
MVNKLFIIILYRDFAREQISYVGLFPNKQEILNRIPILSYNDLIYKEKKYKTPKALFTCLEVPMEKKHFFNTYHLTNDMRFTRQKLPA